MSSFRDGINGSFLVNREVCAELATAQKSSELVGTQSGKEKPHCKDKVAILSYTRIYMHIYIYMEIS